MTSRSKAEISPQNMSSASSSTTIRYANTTIQSSETQDTNFANASMSNTSVEHSAEDSAVTTTHNIWVRNSTDVKGNHMILKPLRGFGLSLDHIMCSHFGSGLTNVNFFTTILAGAHTAPKQIQSRISLQLGRKSCD